MKAKKVCITGMALVAGWVLWSEGIEEDGWKRFSHPGIPVDGREGRTILDNGDFIVIEVKPGEKPLGYTLGPMKTQGNAVIEYSMQLAVESSGEGSSCTVSLLARDENMKELADDLGKMSPDYTVLTPMWQTLGNRAVMPEGTHYVEMRLTIEGPMKLHTQQEGIRAIGLWSPADDPSLHQKARISNGILDVVFNPEKKRLGVSDKRSGKTWETFALPEDFGFERIQTGKLADGNRVIVAEGVYRPYVSPFRLVFMLAPEAPKLTCKTEMAPELNLPAQDGAVISVPRFKATEEGHQLVIPVGGTHLYPTNSEDLKPMTWELADNPAWYGVTEGKEGPAVMTIVTTFQHASVSLGRLKSESGSESGTVTVQWLACKGMWDYPREVTFWFAETGGANALEQHFYNRTF